jgi:uncharacterized protein (TIGR02391 family)
MTPAPVTPISPFRAEHLEAIAKALADTSRGLTGPEIGHTLAKCGIVDPDPSGQTTKWKRLYNALGDHQNSKGYGNHVVAFIHKAMSPARWTGKSNLFDDVRADLNRALAFSGLTLFESGEVKHTTTASTLKEAGQRAGRLRNQLELRNVHADVLTFCKAELLQDNYFHAVLEATKSVANKIRTRSGLTSDGANLATSAFALGQSGKPLLAINPLTTDTHRSEQAGFTNLLIGLFGTFRNPTAHGEKIYWPIDEQDALDILSLVSLVHRKIDNARKL